MKKEILLVSVLLFTLFPVLCSAELTLPDSLTVLEEEAFCGDTSLTDVTLPDSIQTIGPRAFAESSLRSIYIPSSLEDIAADTFDGVLTPLLIQSEGGAPAVGFALAHNIDFRADTVCRALLIGQTAYPEGHALEGPAKDIPKMDTCLSQAFEVTVAQNLTAEQITSAILSAFSDAKEEDISLFYYSGHGYQSSEAEMNGALIGIDYSSYLPPSDLKSTLDRIPGRKIVLIDSCYSGSFVGRGEKTMEDPAVSIVKAFAGPPLLLFSALTTRHYYVIASSSGSEVSWEVSYGGLFTSSFVESKTAGDVDGDGVVSFEEAYQYTAAEVSRIAATAGKKQSVQVYPEDCCWFGMFR